MDRFDSQPYFDKSYWTDVTQFVQTLPFVISTEKAQHTLSICSSNSCFMHVHSLGSHAPRILS